MARDRRCSFAVAGPSVLDVVSLLPAEPAFESVAALLERSGTHVRVHSDSSVEDVRRRIRDKTCHLVVATDDATGSAALDDQELCDDVRVIVVLERAPDDGAREEIRREHQGRGAFVTLFADDLDLALIECALDAALFSSGAVDKRPSKSMTMAGRGTLSSLNITRELLFGSLRHLVEAPPGAQPFALYVVAIDRYRVISDSLLTEGTSALLEAVIERLNRLVRPQDTVAYLGDGRFAVLAMGEDDPGLGEALSRAAAEPFTFGDEPLYLETAVGLTRATRKYECAEDVIRDGIIAARQSQLGGAPAVFEASMRTEEAQEIRLEAELRRAVEARNFRLAYQPIVELPSGKLLGFEALVRWTSPTSGFVSPARFIPVLERTELIIDLGAWILQEAASQLARWKQELSPPARLDRLIMSVNVSAKQLPRPELVEHVRETLEDTKIDPSTLKLEFTETATMEKPTEVAAVLTACKELGVKVWVDDFGTGYSSLGHIRRFPVDGLKLDKAFVDPLDGTLEGSTMARAVMGVAGVIGVAVVAEGIESEAQAAELVTLGCQRGQGYFFSKPLDVEAATVYIAERCGSDA